MNLKQALPTFEYNKPADVIINVGSSKKFHKNCKVYINHPMDVNTTIDKLKAFNKLKGKVNIPKYTNDINKTLSLKLPIYERHSLRGTQGTGINVVTNYAELSKAPLYVEGLDVVREYRVIVVNKDVVSTTLKVPKHSVKCSSIRNLANGWKYTYKLYSNVETYGVGLLAKQTINVLGLHFGAVDIVVDINNKYYVLEVNSAFGLGRNNLKKFTVSIKKLVDSVGIKDLVITKLKNILWQFKLKNNERGKGD